MIRAGVLSDTHGLLRPEAVAALKGCDHILHAGDIGDAKILDQLAAIAPVTAIRGNVDRHGPCSRLPATEVVELGGLHLYLIHSVDWLDLNPAAAGFAAVVSGHSHQPSIEWRPASGPRRVLYLNPGSCGPRRFSLPVSLGFLRIGNGSIEPELISVPQLDSPSS